MIRDHRIEPLVTLVLPVYNAQPFLDETLTTVLAWLGARPEAWELIVVDDGSTDDTPGIIGILARENKGEAITHVRFTQKRGKGFAVRVGLGLARGKYVLFTDCDAACPFDNAADIVDRLEAGADVAIACHIGPSFHSRLHTRRPMGRMFDLIRRAITLPRLPDTRTGLKGFRTEAVRPLLGRLVMNGSSFGAELLRGLVDRGARIDEVPVLFRRGSGPGAVRIAHDSVVMMRDLMVIRLRSWRGVYRRATDASRPARLMVRADDYGLSPGVNQAIQEGLEAGFLTSASIMMGLPHTTGALWWAAAHPSFRFGAHLNLTQGRPVLPAGDIPSLVTRSGEFHPLGRFLLRYFTGRVRSRQVRNEWRAQIAAMKAAGVRVTHLDSHHHVHLLPRFCTRVTVPLAREQGIRMRAMDGPLRGGGPWSDLKGILLAYASRAARRAGIGQYAEAQGAGTALMRRPTLAVLQSLLSRMKPGRTYELVVHPGIVDLALKATGDGYVEGRQKEQELLSSEEYRAALRHAGVELAEPDHMPAIGAKGGL